MQRLHLCLPVMAEPFKNWINQDVIAQMAHHIQRAWPRFPAAGFQQAALQGLDALELKARVNHVAQQLAQHLPADFAQSADILVRSLKRIPPPVFEHDPDKALGELQTDDTGLAGWSVWIMGEYVATHGLDHPHDALPALHALTQRSTAEFAIRPFLLRHPDLCFQTLQTWAHDPSAHVRRLVSEGSRPRLPWGLRLHPLVQDPSPCWPLIRQLQDDPSEYVRRSVANHLNDIGKDHPDLLVDWVKTHLSDASPQRQKLLRHASRSLIKQAHPGMLAAWGLHRPFEGQVQLTLSSQRLRLGDDLHLTVHLQATSHKPQTVALDYVVHHVRANGGTSPKVFKGKEWTLDGRGAQQWHKRHSLKPVTTRTYYPGLHRVDVQINGQVVATGQFELLL